MEIKNENWKREIVDAFVSCISNTTGPIPYNNPNNELEAFLSVIWEKSMKAFDIPREVQVVVDAKNTVLINVGTPSFV